MATSTLTKAKKNKADEFYTGCTSMTIQQVKESILAKCPWFIPYDVNLRFKSQPVKGRTKHVEIVLFSELPRQVLNAFGFTDDAHVSWRNSNPHGVSHVYMDHLRKDPCYRKILAEGSEEPPDSYDPALFPFNHTNLTHAAAFTSTHETWHMLGLVDPLMYGDDGNHNVKRVSGNGDLIMDNGDFRSHMQRFGKTSVPSTWKLLNHYYLRFITPENMK